MRVGSRNLRSKMMNMKLSILLLILSISPIAFAEEARQKNERNHYKCHLSLEDDSVVIHHFVTAAETKSEFENELTKRVVFAADGVTSWQIIEIYECVTAKQRFTSKEARELESKTPL